MPAFLPHTPVIYTLDILSHILQHLSWYSLLLWADMPGVGVQARIVEIRRRVFAALQPFISHAEIGLFFDLLDSCEGLVVGSVARGVLLACGDHEERAPYDLNIIIPRNAYDKLHQFFRDRQYEHRSDIPRDIYARWVSTVEFYEKRMPGGEVARITVSHSYANALSALLGSPCTIFMNAISKDSIITFFPNLLERGEGLLKEGVTLDSVQEEGRNGGTKLEIEEDNSHWGSPCGDICPMRWRKTLDDKGVASYRWFPVLADAQIKRPGEVNFHIRKFDPLVGQAMRFRLTKRCRNAKCRNCQLYQERSEYIDL